MAADELGTLEVRLALVCYGGVSLAVYMHGITREIQEMTVGSALRLGGDDAEMPGTAGVYADLLAMVEEALADRGDPRRIRAGVDIVAGTSAGGINGICLARALDGDRSQEAVRDFWLEKADFGALLDPKVHEFVTAARAESDDLRGLVPPVDQFLAPPTGHRSLIGLIPGGKWIRRARALLRLAQPAIHLVDPPPLSVLNGDVMCSLAWEALKGMQKVQPPRVLRLLFDGSGIDLSVTATEFAGHQNAVALSDQLVFDEAHRHVFRIHGTGEGSLDRDVAMLAFAARATASFPGAFAPISLAHFRSQVSAEDGSPDWDGIVQRYLRRAPTDEAAATRLFVDGGVLDNMPFDAALAAIRSRTAPVEVRRALVYIEPSPAPPNRDDPLRQPDISVHPANIMTGTWRSVSTIPLSQTMGDQITKLRRRNDDVVALRSVIEQSFSRVAEQVEAIADSVAAGGPNPLTDPAAPLNAAWWSPVSEQLHASGDLTPTYTRIKIGGVVDRFAGTIAEVCGFPDEALPRELVGVAVRRCAVERGLLPRVGQEVTTAPGADRVSEQRTFLQSFDVDYERRRIAFVRDGVSWLYSQAAQPGWPDGVRLDRVKAILADRAAELEVAWNHMVSDPAVRTASLGIFGETRLRMLVPPETADPAWLLETKLGDFVVAHSSALLAMEDNARMALAPTMRDFGQTTLAHVMAVLRDWTSGELAKRRRDLLVRYIGFPIWDAITYPITVQREIGERDGQIELHRISPLETRFVAPPLGEPKLYGVETHHFGAFFNRSYRENDYLWGRLDGCCQLIRLLVRLLDPEHAGASDVDQLMSAACERVLREEWQALANIPTLKEHLWHQVAPGKPVPIVV